MFSRPKLTFAMPLSAALFALGTVGLSAPATAQTTTAAVSPWQGFYVGLNAGGAWSTADADATISTSSSVPSVSNPIVIPPGDITAINAANVKGHLPSAHHNTFTGGLEGGYNYVTNSGFLFGAETDINYFHIRRSGSRSVMVTTLPDGGCVLMTEDPECVAVVQMSQAQRARLHALLAPEPPPTMPEGREG